LENLRWQNWLIMHKTEKVIVYPKEFTFIRNLLLLYPDRYRKKFQQEILITVEDMYQERLLKVGKVNTLYWFVISFDIIKSACNQHVELLNKQGMKKYIHETLQIDKFNIIGGLLLLPFFIVFLIDLATRIAQGDLTRYNRPVYAILSHSLLYWLPVLFTWVVIFPTIAVLLNIIPLIKNVSKFHNDVFHFSFLRKNIFSLLILAVGFGFLALIALHDFAPCVAHGLLRLGFTKLPYIISFCNNA
jgi:hypothetical protein